MASTSMSTLHRRPTNLSGSSASSGGGPLIPDVDPPPKPPKILQLLAFGLIAFLACLQFLPATHFRHPDDPYRNWIPHDLNHAASTGVEEIKEMHVFSWTDCLDLRPLAVLVNSTLSSSRFPERIHFHFYVPEDEDVKLSYYKMKVIQPHSNLDITGLKEVKEKLRTAMPEMDLLGSSLHELIPLVVPILNPSLSRYVYISPNTMMKGNIEELFGVDLGIYGIAAAKDCSNRLGNYVNIDVLNAIQRTAAKTWVSIEPYDRNACKLDFNLVVFNALELDKNLMEAIVWWTKVLDMKDDRNSKTVAAVELALYNRYLDLPSVWKIHDSMPSEFYNGTNIVRYDGPARVCSEGMRQYQGLDSGNMWQQYLDPKSGVILAH